MDEVRRAYDPLPDLAALIDGLEAAASAACLGAANSALVRRLADLLAGPYARLRGGLLLDAAVLDDVTTEQAIREALTSFITRTGKLLTPAELSTYVTEAEHGYDPAQLAERILHPGDPGHEQRPGRAVWPVQYGSLDELTEALRRDGPREMLAAGRVYSVRYGLAESHVHEGGRYGVPGYRHSHLAGAEPHEHEEMVLDPPPGFTGHAPEPHPELGPGSGHQADGPAGCSRCQLIRDNQDWIT